MKKNFILTVVLLGSCLMLSSCITKSKIKNASTSAIEGYEWLEGVWEEERTIDYYRVEISKDTYTVYENWGPSYENKPIEENVPIEISEGQPMCSPVPVMMLGSMIIHERDRCLEYPVSEWGGPRLKKVSGPTVLSTRKKKCSLDGAKALVDALDKSGYVAFLGDGFDNTSYTVLHPFEYCEGSERGIAYDISYGLTEEQIQFGWSESDVVPRLNSYGEYEIIGGVLRIRDIQYKHGYGNTDPRVYDIKIVNGNLWLDRESRVDVIPGAIIGFLEQGENNYHL